jgi:hypothetical protein
MGARARVHAIGLAGGLAAAYALVLSGRSGFAPPVFAGAVLVSVVATELGRARPDPADSPRPGATASLHVRRVRDYLPASLARATVASAAVTIVGLGIILGFGRFGRSDWHDLSGFSGPFSEMGVFPGIGMVGLLVSTWVTVIAAVLLGSLLLWLVARSPRPAGDSDLIRRDERWRLDVATTVAAAVGWVTAVPLASVAFLLAAVMAGWGPGWLLPFGAALVGAAAVLLALRFAGRLLDDRRTETSPQWTNAGV